MLAFDWSKYFRGRGERCRRHIEFETHSARAGAGGEIEVHPVVTVGELVLASVLGEDRPD